MANPNGVTPVTLSLPALGTVAGTVNYANGTPAAHSFVYLQQLGMGSYTDVNGHYSVPNVPAQTTFTVSAFAPNTFFTAATSSPSNTIASDAQTLTINLALPPVAGLHVVVLKTDSTPAAGVSVQVLDPAGSSPPSFSGTTNINGIVNVPVSVWGNFTVTALVSAVPLASSSGAVAPADQGQILNVGLTVPATTTGTVNGIIYAGDGYTPAYSSVAVQDNATGAYLGSTWTDLYGHYQIANIAAGSQGFTVTAAAASNSTVTVTGTSTFASNGQIVTRDLTLPLAAISGTVTFYDGSPVPNPQVFVTQTDTNGNTQSYFLYSGGAADGSFSIVGGMAGQFTISAQDPVSGLAGTYNGSITNVAQPVNVAAISLQPSGKVDGTVFDPDGNPFPYPALALTSGSQADYTSISGEGDGSGYFQFDHVPLGNFSLQASTEVNWNGMSTSASGTLASPGGVSTVNITTPLTQTVFGTALQPDGVTPDPFAYVEAETLDSVGPLDHFATYGAADAAGNYIFGGLPVGNERISTLSRSLVNRGLTRFALSGLSPLLLNLQEGNANDASSIIFNLDGSDGFRYDVGCDGTVYSGGTTDGSLSAYQYGGFSLALNNNFYQCPLFNDLVPPNPTTSGTLGPEGLGGVQVTRKVFSPSGGGFIRYLEELTNPSSTDLVVTVKVEGFLSGTATEVFTGPSSTGSTYAIVDNSGQCCAPVLGFVFAGPGASVPVGSTHFANQDTTVSYTWNVSIPAGQTAILMHFGIQRNITDDAGAVTQAQGLVNLTDPNALTGMTAAEQSEVVNFVVQ